MLVKCDGEADTVQFANICGTCRSTEYSKKRIRGAQHLCSKVQPGQANRLSPGTMALTALPGYKMMLPVVAQEEDRRHCRNLVHGGFQKCGRRAVRLSGASARVTNVVHRHRGVDFLSLLRLQAYQEKLVSKPLKAWLVRFRPRFPASNRFAQHWRG